MLVGAVAASLMVAGALPASASGTSRSWVKCGSASYQVFGHSGGNSASTTSSTKCVSLAGVNATYKRGNTYRSTGWRYGSAPISVSPGSVVGATHMAKATNTVYWTS